MKWHDMTTRQLCIVATATTRHALVTRTNMNNVNFSVSKWRDRNEYRQDIRTVLQKYQHFGLKTWLRCRGGVVACPAPITCIPWRAGTWCTVCGSPWVCFPSWWRGAGPSPWTQTPGTGPDSSSLLVRWIFNKNKTNKSQL